MGYWLNLVCVNPSVNLPNDFRVCDDAHSEKSNNSKMTRFYYLHHVTLEIKRTASTMQFVAV